MNPTCCQPVNAHTSSKGVAGKHTQLHDLARTYAFRFLKHYGWLNILNKSENATLQLSIFCENVLDKKYILKLNNVS